VRFTFLSISEEGQKVVIRPLGGVNFFRNLSVGGKSLILTISTTPTALTQSSESRVSGEIGGMRVTGAGGETTQGEYLQGARYFFISAFLSAWAVSMLALPFAMSRAV